MARERHSPRPLSHRSGEMFADSEHAWLWFSRCQAQRYLGARTVADAGDIARPCDPDDIYQTAATLLRQGVLGRRHARVLARYGLRQCPPDRRDEAESEDARLWAEALELLSPPLCRKGIVAPPAAPDLPERPDQTGQPEGETRQ